MYNDFKCTWKTHLEGLDRGVDFEGCYNVLAKFQPLVIFVWSAASCRVLIGETRKITGIEPTVRAFWEAAMQLHHPA